MQIPSKGWSKEAIFEELAARKCDDLPWNSGRVMAYVYDPGQETREVAERAYMMYLNENALDPTTFPSVMRMEREVVRMVIGLLRGEDTVVGNLTSGGTESNMLAIKTARDWARAHRPQIQNPEMVIPRTAHPSFHKACAYFGIKPVVVGFDPITFRADVEAMRAAITENTILIAGSAPGYAQGVVDPIPEIAALALEHGLWCHVDACVGGIHLSFMRKLGYPVPPFDFAVPGVTSISADMHKFGYAPKNASVVMYRNKEMRKYQIFSCMQTTTYALINPTLLSSKSGAPMAGSWATLCFLGEEGYLRIVREVQEATASLLAQIRAIPGLRVLGNPDMCMFSFTSEEVNLFQVADEMSRRGWYIQPQFSTALSPYNLHITMNHSSAPFVDALAADLRTSMEAVRTDPTPIGIEAVRAQVNELLAADPTQGAAQLMTLAGMNNAELPEGMALINTLLECVPDVLGEELLAWYLNELYQ